MSLRRFFRDNELDAPNVGSWARRVAVGLEKTTGQGSWARRVVEDINEENDLGPGSWKARLNAAIKKGLVTEGGQSGPPPDPPVEPNEPVSLNELDDVNVDGALDGAELVFNQTAGQWQPSETQWQPSETLMSSSFLNNGTTQSASATIDKPVGVEEGDLLVAFVRIANSTWSNLGDVTPPSGWTLVRRDSDSPTSSFRSHIGIFTKTAGASEPSDYTWSRGPGTFWAIEVHRVVGYDVAADDNGGGATASQTFAIPEVTAAADGSLLLAAWSAWRGSRDGKWGGPPSPMTELWNDPDAATTEVIAAMSAWELVDIGATGSRSASIADGTADRLAGASVILSPKE